MDSLFDDVSGLLLVLSSITTLFNLSHCDNVLAELIRILVFSV